MQSHRLGVPMKGLATAARRIRRRQSIQRTRRHELWQGGKCCTVTRLVFLCQSVFRRLFGVIDHEDIDRPLRRVQFEPELFLHRGEERGARLVRWVRDRRSVKTSRRRKRRRKREIDIEGASEPGPIAHDTVHIRIRLGELILDSPS